MGFSRIPITFSPRVDNSHLERHEWAKHYFPNLFTRPFTDYQKKFWQWGWEIEPDTYYRPRVECEPRGVGKSTNVEALVCSFVARRKRKMIGYVSFEEDKAKKHFDAIKSMLETPAFLAQYPHCRPKVQTIRGSIAQWSRDALITRSNAMIVPLSLQGSSRGWKSPDGNRFDCIILDDIDKMGMGVATIAKLLELLKSEILAAGDDNTLVIMPQNLIHRESICQQVFDQRADIISDRIFCGPYPLLKEYEAEKVAIDGDNTNAKYWRITSGEPFDPAIDLRYAEALLNKFGKDTFDRECQQEVDRVGSDKDFREWSEIHHIITWSEFRKFFEAHRITVWSASRNHPVIPPNWNIGIGLDWGTTPGHPSAAAPFAKPPEGAPLADSVFGFTEIILPEFPLQQGEEIPPVSPGRVAALVKERLAEWNVQDGQVTKWLMSHEASAALNTMRIDLAKELQLFFNKWQAQKGSGVPQMQQMMEIDWSKEHPFRAGITGCPRFFLIVPDDQGELLIGDQGKTYVAQPYDYKGFARARFEIPLYSQYNTGQNKIKDDWVDAARGIANAFFVPSVPKSRQQQREDKLPEHLRDRERIMTEQPPHIQERINLQRMVEFGKIDQQESRERAKLSKYRPTVPRLGVLRRR
jgi:hypothetical protein